MTSDFVSDFGASNHLLIRYKRDMKNNIRKYRNIAGISQQKLADAIGVGKAAISKLERGDMQLTTVYLKKISAVLNCSPEELYNSSSPKKSSERAIIYTLKELIKLVLNEQRQPITREKIRKDLIFGLAYLHDEPDEAAVLDELLEYVEGMPPPEEIPKPQQTLKLVPPV